jgi:hypothetical protein
MADLTDSKLRTQKSYPVEAEETSNLLSRVETLLTPEKLKSRYLKGVDVSDYTSDELKDEINLAINEFELFSGVTVMREQFNERVPYDSNLYKNFLHWKMNHKPVLSVDLFAVESSNGTNIYKLPADWIEMGFAHKGQINLLPILTVFGTSGTIATSAPDGALIFLQSLSNYKWLPAFWTIKYTSGLCKEEGKLPVVVNQIIGMITAIEILSAKQNQITNTSQSLSQDGLSQATSGLGPQTYKERIEKLEERKDKLMARVKSIFHSKYYLTNI